jgi:hypothetical protein
MSARLIACISEAAIRRGFREIWYWGTCMKIWLHMLRLINIGKNVDHIVAVTLIRRNSIIVEQLLISRLLTMTKLKHIYIMHRYVSM